MSFLRVSPLRRRSFGLHPRAVRGGRALFLAIFGAAVIPAWAEQQPPIRRTSEALVREALSHEIAGLTADRERLLDRALAAVPDFPAAHWHKGEVRVGRDWRSITDAIETDNEKRVRQQYEERRLKAADTVEGQLALADWCAERRLAAQETAHLNRVIQLDPNHQAARSRLQYERIGNRWVRGEGLWQGMRQESQVTESLRKWQKRLDEIVASLRRSGSPKTAAMVRQLQSEVTVDAIPAVEVRLGNESEAAARIGVEILGSIQSPAASAALVRLAVFSPWPSVQEAAAKELRSRPQDHYVPMLLAELSTPIESRIQASLVNGRILYRHEFVRETQDRRENTVLDTVMDRRPSMLRMASGGSGAGIDTGGGALPTPAAAFGAAISDTRSRALAEARLSALLRERSRLEQNRIIESMNTRICETLCASTGKYLPADPQAWWSWWDAENEVQLGGEKPYETSYRQDYRVYTDVQPVVSSGPSSYGGRPSSPPPPRVECFVAGTPVWTISGLVDIEKVRVGDRVLSQNPETGELAYPPVLQTTQRPPERLIKLHLATRARDTLEGSGGHPLWVAGEGWVNMRRLASGMILHGVTGSTLISDVEETDAQATYNLVVDQFHTYVVGDARILCHDNTPRRPTSAVVPGLTVR